MGGVASYSFSTKKTDSDDAGDGGSKMEFANYDAYDTYIKKCLREKKPVSLGMMIECKYCAVVYESHSGHYEKNHKPPLVSYDCEPCGFHTRKKKDFTAHLKTAKHARRALHAVA